MTATAVLELTEADISLLLGNLDALSEDERHELDLITETLHQRQHAAACRDDLLLFCKAMQDDYKVGAHHRVLAKLLMEMERGEKDRITVSLPPRHGKSMLVSTYYPAWYLGKHPEKKVIIVSHTADLAVDFGRKMRNIVASPVYRDIFPDITLSADSKSAGRWDTNQGGTFYACGVGSSLAGRGADLLLCDDLHSEQDVLAGNYETFDRAYEWFTFGARTRLMPQGRIAVIGTRWHESDVIGRLIKDMTLSFKADQYEVVEFPAILNDNTPEKKALWPEFFDLDALERTKASMPSYQWMAQFQQQPTGKEAAIVKREWWRWWKEPKPPTCDYVIMALDAAAEEHNRADFTSITTWGVFYVEAEETHNIILLNAIKERMEFPELKKKALEQYKQWEPDAFIVEKKSSGTPLYQELRRMDIIVQEYTPVRGAANNPNTKMARLNSISDIIKSGLVWVPQTRWAEEVVDEVCGFPNAANDDHCLVAGTQIRMADGTCRSIECIFVGDQVQTPIGPRKVTAAGYTGVRDVLRMDTANAVLYITENHPVATPSGWVRPLHLNHNSDIIVASTSEGVTSWCSRLKQALWWRRLSSTGDGIGATQTAHDRHTGGTLASLVRSFMQTCGVSITGRYLQDTTCTTSTGTRETTASRTLRACLLPSTGAFTSLTFGPWGSQRNPDSTLKKFVRRLRSGTSPRQAGSGTGSTQRSLWALLVWLTGALRLCLPSGSVPCAANSLSVYSSRTSCVQLLARRQSTGPRPNRKSWTWCVRAWSVVQRFTQFRRKPSTALCSAKISSTCAAGKRAVYNLSVEGAHCYFANSVLVHNCDTTIMALMRFRQGGFITLPSDSKEPKYFRPRRAAYY